VSFWPLPPADLPPLERGVHVWAIGLDDDNVDLGQAREFIFVDERERAERFKFERDRRRYLIAHASLHEILRRYLPIDSEPLSFDYGSNGKPKLSQALAASGVQFNLSHSSELALLAVTQRDEVGVDIEYVKENFEFQDIAEKFFTAKEVATMRSLPVHLQRRAFFKCWTSKEAFLKAKGTGLSGNLDEVEISLTATQEVQITASVPGWSLTELAPIDSYEAALVVEGAPLPISHYLWRS
jgi:4'-phosphopantetheinyl transferase